MRTIIEEVLDIHKITINKHDVYNHTDTQNLTPNKFANILRFGATMFKDETSSKGAVLTKA